MDAAERAQRAEEEAAPTSDDVEMERQLEGEADLPAAGGSPRCDPVGDDEDEMSICDAFDEAEGSNSIRPAARGEALDDEAPAAMATGGEASGSAPGDETILGRRGRGEAFDDEAPTAMAEGNEGSSSAPPVGKRPRRAKSKKSSRGRGNTRGWGHTRSVTNEVEREGVPSRAPRVVECLQWSVLCRGGVEVEAHACPTETPQVPVRRPPVF